MAKVRFGVVLLVPAPTSHEVDGLRRALGEPWLRRVPPHLTLVPPVNVRVDAVGDAVAALRSAAARVDPITLTLGPVRHFLPDNPTLYLAVGGADEQVAALHRLRDAVFVEPLARPLTWPFVPHVTIHDDHPADEIPSAAATLAAYRAEVTFGSVHLLQEQRHGDAHRRWVPVAEARLGPRRVVGRGGLELDLHVSAILDPEAAAAVARWHDQPERPGDEVPAGQPAPSVDGRERPVDDPARRDDPARPDDQPGSDQPAAVRALGRVPVGGQTVVVTGRREGAVVGVGVAWHGAGGGDVVHVEVAPAVRGQGIARHLLAALDDEVAAARG
ncbi:MAG: 2'-5' RNA ligase family protein [Acidimicrobiales bacterium]